MTNCSSMVFCVSFILTPTFFFLCDADDDNPKLHIVYMRSLPKSAYSPSSHHLSILQQVVDGNNAESLFVYSYKRSFNGFAAYLTKKQREKLAQREGVVSAFPSTTPQTHTTRTWDLMGFSKSVKRRKTVESDVIIGVIDTRIWPESDGFGDQGFGPVPKRRKGTCAGGRNFPCNKQIIGVRFYVDESARDNDGHGTHTASTVTANKVNNASFYGIAQGTARGGVPSARISVYKVCNPSGCNEAGTLAAF